MCEYKVLDSCVRSHHVYKSILAPAVGETLACEVEFGNIHDPSAVAVHKPGVGESSFETVGYWTHLFYSVKLIFVELIFTNHVMFAKFAKYKTLENCPLYGMSLPLAKKL